MLSSDQNINTISQLVVELKHYIELRTESMQIDIISKLSKLFTALILFLVLFMLSTLAIMFISMTAAAAITSIIGSQACAYAIIVVVYFIIGAIIYINRKRWIEAPITHFIATLFLGELPSPTSYSSKQTNKM